MTAAERALAALIRLGKARTAIKRWSDEMLKHQGLGPHPGYDRAAHARDTIEWHAAEDTVNRLADELASGSDPEKP